MPYHQVLSRYVTYGQFEAFQNLLIMYEKNMNLTQYVEN